MSDRPRPKTSVSSLTLTPALIAVVNEEAEESVRHTGQRPPFSAVLSRMIVDRFGIGDPGPPRRPPVRKEATVHRSVRWTMEVVELLRLRAEERGERMGYRIPVSELVREAIYECRH